MVAWSSSSDSGDDWRDPPARRAATQRRVERFAFGFGLVAFAAFFARAGFADVAGAADFAATGGLAGAGFTAGCCGATAAFATGGGGAGAAAGFIGGRAELDVLSGGSGCFRGRPLFRAACPSAISLSNAAFASASRRACCEFRTVRARSFSARNSSSGFAGGRFVIGVSIYLPKARERERREIQPAPSVEHELRYDLADRAGEFETMAR